MAMTGTRYIFPRSRADSGGGGLKGIGFGGGGGVAALLRLLQDPGLQIPETPPDGGDGNAVPPTPPPGPPPGQPPGGGEQGGVPGGDVVRPQPKAIAGAGVDREALLRLLRRMQQGAAASQGQGLVAPGPGGI